MHCVQKWNENLATNAGEKRSPQESGLGAGLHCCRDTQIAADSCKQASVLFASFSLTFRPPANSRRLPLPSPGGCSWASCSFYPFEERFWPCAETAAHSGVCQEDICWAAAFCHSVGRRKQPPTAVYVTTRLYHKCWPTSVYTESMYRAYYYILVWNYPAMYA